MGFLDAGCDGSGDMDFDVGGAFGESAAFSEENDAPHADSLRFFDGGEDIARLAARGEPDEDIPRVQNLSKDDLAEFTADGTANAEDMGRSVVGIECNEVPRTPPVEFLTGEEILHHIFLFRAYAELLEWDVNKRALRVPRIDRHHEDDEFIKGGSGFAEAEDLVILGGVNAKVVVFTQGTVIAADMVEARYIVLDIPRRVPVAAFELVFL